MGKSFSTEKEQQTIDELNRRTKLMCKELKIAELTVRNACVSNELLNCYIELRGIMDNFRESIKKHNKFVNKHRQGQGRIDELLDNLDNINWCRDDVTQLYQKFQETLEPFNANKDYVKLMKANECQRIMNYEKPVEYVLLAIRNHHRLIKRSDVPNSVMLLIEMQGSVDVLNTDVECPDEQVFDRFIPDDRNGALWLYNIFKHYTFEDLSKPTNYGIVHEVNGVKIEPCSSVIPNNIIVSHILTMTGVNYPIPIRPYDHSRWV